MAPIWTVVLLVDDSIESHTLMRFYFRNTPYDLETASDGEQAVATFKTGRFDFVLIDLHLPGGLVEGSHGLDTARTAGFTTLVFAQLFNCFNARSETASALRGLFRNHWLWGSVALAVLLQVAVVQLPAGNLAFGTAPLAPDEWLACAALASAVLWYGEARKLVIRGTRRERTH